MLYLDYGAYAEETGVDWTVEKLRPASQEIQRLFNIHGRPESLLNPGDLLFRDSAKALGYSVIPLTIAKENCIACGFCSLMCKYDAKMGPLITHVPLAEKLGVQIIPEAEVDKIILEKQGARVVAKGAIYRHQGEFSAHPLSSLDQAMAAGMCWEVVSSWRIPTLGRTWMPR